MNDNEYRAKIILEQIKENKRAIRQLKNKNKMLKNKLKELTTDELL